MPRIAVILFNLGGPDNLQAVRPFLFNLFNDPAILNLPGPLRWCLAQIISRRRAPVAQAIYRHLGGKSPLLALTEAQADALETALADVAEFKVFVAMRYWHPMTEGVVASVRAWKPDEIVLLPLYPQFSTTTSASSLRVWRAVAQKAGLDAPMRAVCCYPRDPGVVVAQARLIGEKLRLASAVAAPRLLFSAHGLPQRIVDRGDPYQWQVEQTAAAVVEHLKPEWPDLDWQVCYQSRVGPLTWIGPSTEAEIERAGRDQKPLVIVPIAFVSEHSETLVELDIEYRARAEAAGVPAFHRVAALGTDPHFVAGLAKIVRDTLERAPGSTSSNCGERLCPARWGCCAMAEGSG